MPSVVNRGYIAWQYCQIGFQRVAGACDAIQQGFWLGMLGKRNLDDLAILQYARWAMYADPAYNRSGLSAWEQSAVESHFTPRSRLLLGAAGGGREALALAERAYRVDAFDCQPALVEACARLIEGYPATRALLAQPGLLPEGLSAYDGAIVGWGGYMHIPGKAQRIAFLSAIREHVTSGSPILISFFVRSADSRRFRWIHAVAGFIRKLRGSAEPIELGDAIAGTFDHYFIESEIRDELDRSGFDLLEFHCVPYGHAIGRAR